MGQTLASATLAVARTIPDADVYNGIATGGSATTLIDTGYVGTVPPADWYNDGTLWLLSGNNIGKTAKVTDWDATTKVWTFTTLTLLCAAADKYAVAPKEYPLSVLRHGVNMALAEIGGTDAYNIATTSVSDQMSYNLPAGVYNIKKVEVANSLVTPFGYTPLNHWRELGGILYFDEGRQLPTTGYIIRLTYRAASSFLTADADAIPDLVSEEWIRWAGSAWCLRWRLGRTRQDEPEKSSFLQEAIAERERMAGRYRPRLRNTIGPIQHSAWAGGGGDDVESTPDHVRF